MKGVLEVEGGKLDFGLGLRRLEVDDGLGVVAHSRQDYSLWVRDVAVHARAKQIYNDATLP